MSNRARERLKGRRSCGGSFSALVHDYFQSSQWAALSHRAARLLIDVYCQYRGKNNGDLFASWSVMKKRGWRSKSQLQKALLELEATRWLQRTRQGDINRPTLYAVTFLGIDYCGGKLEISSDPKPLHAWKYPDAAKAMKLSGRRVRPVKRTLVDSISSWTRGSPARSERGKPAQRADLHTGDAPPHEGAKVTRITDHLTRTEGRSVA